MCVCVVCDIYCEELAHMIMKAEKFHDLLPTSWRHRKASGVVPVQVRRPENWERQW